MSSPRTLSVILAVDAAGYSRLAQADEQAARAAVAWFRERAAEIVAGHGGRVFFRAGDGVMAELPSVRAGVRAALELAEVVRARVAHADAPALPVRIGVHLGDAFTEADGDLLGHDVNVAARLQQTAAPGEVLVSRVLAEAARGKVDAHFEPLGRERMKNLAEPMEIFRATSAAPLARRPLVLIAAVAAAAAVAVGLGYFGGRLGQGATETAETTTATEAAASAGDASIAVLPFVNMSSDPEQEYFSDGLSEELLNQLADIDGLRVIARTSSFAFKGQNADVRTIGQALGVTRLLEGSVRKSGDELRITAQLVDASDGSHIWSETYERHLDDVFAIQEEISVAVAEQLSIALGVGESMRLPGGTRNVEAYELVLQARDQMIHAAEEARGPAATALYRQALALDPDYAQAWTELAGTLVFWAAFEFSRSDELLDDSEAALARALALEPDLAAAYLAGGNGAQLRRDWRAAAQAYGRAGELDARAAAECDLSAMPSLGFTESPVACARSARDSDPLSLAASQVLQRRLTISGDFAEAEAEYERSLAIPGDREQIEHMALLREWENRASPDIEGRMRRYLQYNTLPVPVFREVLGEFDDPDAAIALLHAAAEDPAYRNGPRLALLALWLGHYGDSEGALAVLRRWADGQVVGATDLIWFPSLAETRRLPGFKDLVRDFGLVDYWRATGNWGDFCRPVGDDDFECE